MQEIPDHIKGLVFDCDGTLADTMPLHYRCWVEAVGEYGHTMTEALFYETAGISSVNIVKLLNERHGYNMPPEQAAELKDKLFEQKLHDIEPIEPVVALVRKYAGKLPMAVATGGTRSLCTKTLQVLDLLKFFQSLITADDVPHGKPAPDIYLEAARRLALPPADCCAFEDGEPGILAAKAAGMMVVDIRPMRR
jgi:HAD superfamily hydrolase (TIGR01509 family)